MIYTNYDKPYQTPSDLIIKLKAQNLTIEDETKALKVLSSVNYFRFKIYLRPLLDVNIKQYLPNTTFENAFELYSFDEELKGVLFKIISNIEINLRTKLDHHITSFTNNPFWYLEDKYFSNSYKIQNTRISLRNEFLRSKDDFILHFKENYINNISNDFKEMPPFWSISELSTFGNILSIFGTLDKTSFVLPQNKNVLDNLSQEFGAKNLKELNSWLKLIRDVRNRVAHHSRVWNCNYREPYGIRQLLDETLQPSQPNKIYLFFVILERMQQNNIIDVSIREELRKLTHKYITINSYLHSMGIPQSWLSCLIFEGK